MRAIIIKFDDLNGKTERWETVAQYIIDQNIKASIGIIGKSLEKNDQSYFDWIKKLNNTGRFEFWNHGYNHERYGSGYEFLATPYENQFKNMERTQFLGKEKLGIEFSTFGAPYNKTDSNTKVALNKFPEIKVWLKGDNKLKTKMVLTDGNMRCEFTEGENRFFVDVDKIKSQLEEKRYASYIILQFHPLGWKETGMLAEFYKVIEHIKSTPTDKFMTPIEFWNETKDHVSWQYI